MEEDGWPEQDAGRTARYTNPGEVQGHGGAVGQHPEPRRAGPAGKAQSDQGKPGDARHGRRGAGERFPEKQLADE